MKKVKKALAAMLSLIIFFSFVKSADAAVILVDGNEEGERQSTKEIGVFQDIQSAVNAASEGDTILIGDGDYAGGIIILKNNLSLQTRSHSPGPARISPKQGGSFGIAVAAKNVSIKDLVIHGFADEGIIIGAVPPERTIIGGVGGISIENNFISGNRIGIGINFTKDELKITGNTIQDNRASGIIASEAENVSVSSNNITGNGGLFSGRENFGNGGIRFFMANNNSLTGNKLTNNVSGVYSETSRGNRLEGNTITNNRTEGVTLCFGSSNNLLTLNQITSNRRGLLVCPGGEPNKDNIIRKNTLLNNRIFDIADRAFDSFNNSYSENACKTSNPSGICSK